MEITRRSILVGVAIAAGVTRTTAAEWAPNPHYPDPSIKVLDPSFAKYRPTVVGIERLATGLAWSEGPVWTLSHLERHSQQSPNAVGRGNRRSWSVPKSIEPSER
jgi:hypothetical protein